MYQMASIWYSEHKRENFQSKWGGIYRTCCNNLQFVTLHNSFQYTTILGSQYQCEVCIPTMSTPSMTICSLEQGIVKANIEL